MRRQWHTCQFCRVTFIGPGAIVNWSEHTWVHWDEVKDLAVL